MRLSFLFACGVAAVPFAYSQDPAAADRHMEPQRLDAVHRVDAAQMYHRIYARVPLLGKGTKDDPVRPMFVPTGTPAVANHTGVLGWQMQISDDHNWALVEFVGPTRGDLLGIINSNDPNVKVFERGRNTQAEIETEFQKYKKGFTLASFNTRVQ